MTDNQLLIRFLILLAATVALLTVGCSYPSARKQPPLASFDVSPDGGTLVFSAEDGNLYLLDLKSSEVRQVTRTVEAENFPAFSPDGKSVVCEVELSEDQGSQIHIIPLDGSPPRPVTTDVNVRDHDPAFSPDGARITFVRAPRRLSSRMSGVRWFDWDVCAINADGTQLRNLTAKKYHGAASPQFSGDGQSVIYSADAPKGIPPQVVYEIDAAGAQPPKAITADFPEDRIRLGEWAFEPSVSKDGRTIAFISDRKETYFYDVLLMNRDGSNVRSLNVTNVSKQNRHPVLARDGKSVLFLGMDSNLRQVDIDGSNPRLVADATLFKNPLRWRK